MADVVPKMSKKDQITTLFQLGITGVEELSTLTHSSPSYIAAVLRDSKMLAGYFDLYTSSSRPMNVYSKYFANRLGFKDEATSHRSVYFIDTLYKQFARIGDRAGQHHALFMALTMRNRALWSDKTKEAKIFSDWLIKQLQAEEKEAPEHDAAAERMERLIAERANRA